MLNQLRPFQMQQDQATSSQRVAVPLYGRLWLKTWYFLNMQKFLFKVLTHDPNFFVQFLSTVHCLVFSFTSFLVPSDFCVAVYHCWSPWVNRKDAVSSYFLDAVAIATLVWRSGLDVPERNRLEYAWIIYHWNTLLLQRQFTVVAVMRLIATEVDNSS